MNETVTTSLKTAEIVLPVFGNRAVNAWFLQKLF